MTTDEIIVDTQKTLTEKGFRELNTQEMIELRTRLSHFKTGSKVNLFVTAELDKITGEIDYSFEVEAEEPEELKKQKVVFAEGSENFLKEILDALKSEDMKPPISTEKTFSSTDKEFEKYVNGLYNSLKSLDYTSTPTKMDEELPTERRKYLTAEERERREKLEKTKEMFKNSSLDNISGEDTVKIFAVRDDSWENSWTNFATRFPQVKQNCLISDIESTFEECLEIVKRKNKDYGETEEDPYKNFRNSESVGVSPEKAILVRISDKLSRISTLLSQDAEVKQESIEDTINDAINYFAILKSFLKNN